ncbi:pyruvate dehydrogenase E2 component (dihydrolipoamide acetyltransferase) [Mycoplasmoides fastidiosum]|uniref:Dihydrolipoamide acetyltransferase component of pyruvate dehydrogenase complex n=1 Tax=Mycoplasmoides fastidiosum TaxID=92758 RepID=A0ABU0LYV3_9BACT|nr:dihydrolipoamide acetyltransferase family protein [Mycoplasmoides fastidiosum]MDQ0513893.1 pyruvate dehydrogenase E2 component (dihydrolipoamide acetyltransferase) [Mycoplasmoides fastidiosum]UUD37693.1 2-oxo acid dehydrogenase subunit E2 [Mycoplasmoides fastidiosum]
MYQFKFADIGEGLHEGKVTQIFVRPGDSVKDGDRLFEVETDKVTSEITSPIGGKITEIKITPEQTVHVGDVVFLIDDGSGSSAAPAVESKPEAAPAAGGASVVGQVKVSDEVLDFGFSKKTTSKPISPTPLTTSGPISLSQARAMKLKISPFLVKYAEAHHIDLTQVKPTRADGIILKTDLDAVANAAAPVVAPTPTVAAPASASATPKSTGPSPTMFTGFVARREKTSSLRQAIARNLKNSWNKVAYTNLVIQADVTELWNLRSSIKDSLLKTTGIKITFLPFIAKATAIALTEFPIFISQYDEATQELVYPDTINLGIAVDTDQGLMVPNIKDAQSKSVLQMANEIISLAKKARAKELKGADMSGGNFTITNYGSAGALFGVPVIKFPEVAILGIGTIIDQVQSVSLGGMGDNRKIMYLTIAADHRWIDGAAIGHFGTRIRQLLENPSLLSVY